MPKRLTHLEKEYREFAKTQKPGKTYCLGKVSMSFGLVRDRLCMYLYRLVNNHRILYLSM